MKIYTRKGDKGETSLFSGQRVPKNNPFIEALGAIDECNCTIGSAVAHLPDKKEFAALQEELLTVQHALFDLGAAVATPRTHSADEKIERTRFDSHATLELEEAMDRMEGHLPPLKTFILPGGHPAGAFLHLARATCRRAERTILPLMEHADLAPAIPAYLNRLSDYLFMASRYANHLIGKPEVLWEQHKKPSAHHN